MITVSDLFHNGTLLPAPTEGGGVDWSTKAHDLIGTPLRFSPREWEMLGCDPMISWIITDAGGQPVACRTGERHASRAQRRGLTVRDGGCVFPGCDAPPAWCDAHHVQPHAQDGPTDITNLALLCRHHHGVVHRNGWTMTPSADPARTGGYWTITTTTGTHLHTRHTRRPEPA